MNFAHLHLILNHLPIAGVLFSNVVLILAWRSKSESLRRAALFLVVLTGILTLPAFLTGDSAEDVIKHLPNISETAIKAHEEAAEKSAWAVWITSVIAFYGLVQSLKGKAVAKWVIPAALILGFTCFGLFAWSNYLGGQISHAEIRGK